MYCILAFKCYLFTAGGHRVPPLQVYDIIGRFKSYTNYKSGRPIWQRSFYDHVIRNKKDYEEAIYVVKGLTEMLDHMTIVINEIPEIMLMGKSLIPKRTEDVSEEYIKLTREGYYLDYLNITGKELENNQVTIIGEVVSTFTYNHEIYSEGFYMLDVKVERLSNSFDVIPVMISERLMDVTKDYRGQFLEVQGHFRSYNRHDERKNKLVLSVFATYLPFSVII